MDEFLNNLEQGGLCEIQGHILVRVLAAELQAMFGMVIFLDLTGNNFEYLNWSISGRLMVIL